MQALVKLSAVKEDSKLDAVNEVASIFNNLDRVVSTHGNKQNAAELFLTSSIIFDLYYQAYDLLKDDRAAQKDFVSRTSKALFGNSSIRAGEIALNY